MTEGGPGVDMMRAAFDGFALGRTGSGADMGFCLLLLWLLREVLIGDIGDITAFDVAIEGGGGNGPFTGPAKGADNSVRGTAQDDLLRNVAYQTRLATPPIKAKRDQRVIENRATPASQDQSRPARPGTYS